MDAATTRARLTDRNVNPAVTGGPNPTHVHVDLVFDGVTYTPEQLYDALDAVYGTVTSDKDSLSRGSLQFRISP